MLLNSYISVFYTFNVFLLNVRRFSLNQWRIQDFPEEGAPTPRGGAPTYDFAKFLKNCMKLKEFGPPGGASLTPPLDPPLLTFIFCTLTSFFFFFATHILSSEQKLHLIFF